METTNLSVLNSILSKIKEFHFHIYRFVKVLSVFCVFLLFSNSQCFSQNITYSEMKTFCNEQNWNFVNESLQKKGWDYFGSTKGDEETYNTITWSYNKDYYSDNAQGWFYLFTYEGYPSKVAFLTSNKSKFNIIKNSIVSAGCKIIDTDIDDDKITTKYSDTKHIIIIETSKADKENDYNDNTITAYTIFVIKRESVYDSDNGVKKTFDLNGNIETEITLKDGNLNGKATTYHPNGQIRLVSFYIDNKLNGVSKEYNENGDLIAEFNYIDDQLSGPYKLFNNNRLTKTGNVINGVNNGLFKEFNEQGLLSKEYTLKNDLLNGPYSEYYYKDGPIILKYFGDYLNAKENGLWLMISYDGGKTDTLLSYNFVSGIKQGPFKRVAKDSIIFGYYNNGTLNGELKIFKNLINSLFGIFTGDTTNSTLISSGSYYNNLKTGIWKEYSMFGSLLSEGSYSNDKKIGEWKYYYDMYTKCITNQGFEPFSKELYLIENYKNGKLNGKSIRYSTLEKYDIPCDTNVFGNNSDFTCNCFHYSKVYEEMFYENDILNGQYELKDSTGKTLFKGVYINGLEEGSWIESYSHEDVNNVSYITVVHCNYNKGVLNGILEEYNENGLLIAKHRYSNGKLNGTSERYNSNNKIIENKTFNNNNLTSIIYYDSTGLKIVKKYENIIITKNLYSCDYTFFENDFEITIGIQFKSDIAYENSDSFEIIFRLTTMDTNTIYRGDLNNVSSGWKFEGKYTKRNIKTNKVYKEGQLVNCEKDGVFKTYYYDDDILLEQLFNKGVCKIEHYYVLSSRKNYTGKFSLKNSNGILTDKYTIKDGLRDGKSKYYDETGKLISTVKYEKGIKK